MSIFDPKLVTVIIPTRNRVALLERALLSVRNQTFVDLQIVVVDDASTDSTSDYLARCRLHDPRVESIRLGEQRGAAAARNIGLRAARGRFITALDDDDEFAPNRIEAFVTEWTKRETKRADFSCLFSETYLLDGKTANVTQDRKPRVKWEELFDHNYIGNQVFCETARILQCGGYDEDLTAWEDLDLYIRITRIYGDAWMLAKVTYLQYVDVNRSRISRNERSVRQSCSRMLRKYKDVCPNIRKRLFVQQFGDFHNIRPRSSDIVVMFREYGDMTGALRLCVLALKMTIKKFLHVR